MKKCSRRYSVGPIVHRLVAGEHAVCGAVDAQAAQLDHAFRILAVGAPHHRADAREQLARRERLHDVVVDARVEPADAVGFLAARGQHDDRHFARQIVLAQRVAPGRGRSCPAASSPAGSGPAPARRSRSARLRASAACIASMPALRRANATMSRIAVSSSTIRICFCTSAPQDSADSALYDAIIAAVFCYARMTKTHPAAIECAGIRRIAGAFVFRKCYTFRAFRR
jgi:hypothetical protein